MFEAGVLNSWLSVMKTRNLDGPMSYSNVILDNGLRSPAMRPLHGPPRSNQRLRARLASRTRTSQFFLFA